MNLSFLTLHNPLFFSLYKTSTKTNNIFVFFCFSWMTVQILIFKAEYLENGLADFNDFGLILEDFEWPFRQNQCASALQFSFKFLEFL